MEFMSITILIVLYIVEVFGKYEFMFRECKSFDVYNGILIQIQFIIMKS
jgi:hypothetical protein